MSVTDARCLVLGAGGFIGTNLARGLADAGARVTAYGRPPRDPRRRHPAVAWVEGDFGDTDRLAAAVAGADLVFHLLGGSVPAQSNDRPSEDVLGNLLPSIRLVEACLAARIRRLVFVSSGGTVYGPGARHPIAETAPTNPITAYGINKLAVEKYLGLFRHLHGLDSVVLRVANPYGPFQDGQRAQGVVGTAISHAIAGTDIAIWGDGSVVRDYLHVDDVVAALIAAATYRGPEWIFNVGSGEGRSVTQVVETVCRRTHTPPGRLRYHPARPADTPYNVLDISLIGRELGWHPRVPFDAGIADTIEWWRATRAGG